MSDEEKEQNAEQWINQLLSFIYNLDIDISLKNRVKECLTAQKDLIRSGIVTDTIFGSINMKKESKNVLSDECSSFMNYLNNLLNSKGKDYFKLAIEYALINNDNN